MVYEINISMKPTSKSAACIRFIGLRALLDNLLARGLCDNASIKDFALDGSTYVVQVDCEDSQAVINALDHVARRTAQGSAAQIINPTSGAGVNPSALLSALKTPR